MMLIRCKSKLREATMGTEDTRKTSTTDSEIKIFAKDFHLKEYDALRHAQDALDGRLVTIIQYLLLFAGAIYAFLLSHRPTTAIEYIASAAAWWVPLIASMVGHRILGYQILDIRRISAYLYNVEKQYGFSAVLGFEDFKKKPENKGGTLESLPATWKWIIGLNIVAGLIGFLLNMLPLFFPQ
jgi:hypothetical protein